MPAQVDLPIVQMLCSRLCHDLAGPAGAVGAGSELLGEAAGSDPEALELVAFGARQLGARLGYYRVAFGYGGTPAQLSWAGVRALAEGVFAGGRVTISWPQQVRSAGGDALPLPPDSFRLALLILLLGGDALPRGGTLNVTLAETHRGCELSVVAAGPAAIFSHETRAVLLDNDLSAVTSRTVSAFYAARLAETLGAAVVVAVRTQEVAFRVALPAVTSVQ